MFSIKFWQTRSLFWQICFDKFYLSDTEFLIEFMRPFYIPSDATEFYATNDDIDYRFSNRTEFQPEFPKPLYI